MKHLQGRRILPTGGLLLHIAPEKCLVNRLAESHRCVTVDRHAPGVTIQADVTALCFDDACFDVILCNHVLEHVTEDLRGLSELYRVLKPGGWASIQVPMLGETTCEDSTVTEPTERERLYGQRDHVRQYGADFRLRLQDAGFTLIEIRKEEFLPPPFIKRLSVANEESVLLVRKPMPEEAVQT